MLEHNHQFSKPGVSDVYLYFHQHEINFRSLMLLFFPCYIRVTW